MLERLRNVLLSPRLLRFALVGFSGVFVNLACLALLAEGMAFDDWVHSAFPDSDGLFGGMFAWLFATPHVFSSALAIEVSVIWNFLLNNAWTFKDRNDDAASGFGARLFKYHLVSLVGMALQLACFVVLNKILISALDLQELGLWKYFSQLVGIAFAMGWNFLSNFFYTWRQREPSVG